MRFLIAFCLCLAWFTSRAQTADSELINPKLKIGVINGYLPQFTVRELSGDEIQPIGVRLSLSDYETFPFEFGFQAYGNYEEVATASFGVNLAWLFTGPTLQFKLGVSLSRIELENVEINPDEFGPHVGDVSFEDFSTEIKPYIELEWVFSRFSSLFVQSGYRIINGERTVVTAVEGEGLDGRVTGRDQPIFFSGSGFEFGVGFSINFPLK